MPQATSMAPTLWNNAILQLAAKTLQPGSPMLKIKSYEIFGLHDVQNYYLPKNGSFSDTVILYGDNGSGKTTLLNMLFHLLSPSANGGHRTAITKIPFREIIVKLSDGTVISAVRRAHALAFPIEYSITRPEQHETIWNHFPAEFMERYLRDQYVQSLHYGDKNTVEHFLPNAFYSKEGSRSPSNSEIFGYSDSVAQSNYLTELENIGLNLYFISSDRRIRGDSLGISNDNENERIQNQRSEDPISAARARYLEAALNFAGRWVGKRLIHASNAGAKNSNEIYADLVMRLATADLNESATVDSELAALKADLDIVMARNRGYVKYGLTPRLAIKKIVDVLNTANGKNKSAVKMVVRPYVSSLKARLDALEPIYTSIRTFTESLNEFFTGKTISYVAGRGFRIKNDRDQPLEVAQLSSGEQQLLLIFCYALAVGEKSSCLIIDEPEISLNIKWQRKLINSLKQITIGDKNQLIFATHSIELLAQHTENVHPLIPFDNTNKKIVYEPTAAND